MSDDEYLDWEVPECENCVRTAHHAILNDEEDEVPEKWVCIGNIPPIKNTNDTHKLVNKIRICIRKHHNDKTIELFEWTPYEASLVSAFLTMAVSNELYDEQPYLDQENKLIIPGKP